MIKLKPIDHDVILAMCENNLRVSCAADDLHVHRNTVMYRCDVIKRETGLNPRNFYDAHRLLKLIQAK